MSKHCIFKNDIRHAKKTHHETRTFLLTPPVKSRGLGFPTRYWCEIHLKFFDLEARADRFARFHQYTPQNSKLQTSKMSCDMPKNGISENRKFRVLGDFFEV